MTTKIHFDQHLADGTFVPKECSGPYDFGEYDAVNRSRTITCLACGAAQTLSNQHLTTYCLSCSQIANSHDWGATWTHSQTGDVRCDLCYAPDGAVVTPKLTLA